MTTPPNKPLFTSSRERSLWFGALAAVISIYSTLGLAGTLAQALRHRNLLDTAFFVAFLLIVAAVVGSGLVKRTKWRVVWVALGIIAVYGMLITRMFISPEERTHLIEYGVVAALVYHALIERAGNGRVVPYPAVFAVVLTTVLGWVDESIQALLPDRVYDIRDLGFNALAGIMAIVAILVLTRVREKQIGLLRR